MDFNSFLFYGLGDEAREMEDDLVVGLLQDRRSAYYHRSFGAGLTEYENAPDGVSLQVGLKYRAADWVARRNLEVSDGTGGTRDRRALTSQGAMSVETEGGEKVLRLLYVPYSDVGAARVLATGLSL